MVTHMVQPCSGTRDAGSAISNWDRLSVGLLLLWWQSMVDARQWIFVMVCLLTMWFESYTIETRVI